MVRQVTQHTASSVGEDVTPSQSTTTTHVEVEESDFDKLNPTLRVCWQYGGLFIGTVAILGLLWPAVFYDPDIEVHPFHNIGWTLVILVAYVIHSTRPYQNEGAVTFDDVSHLQRSSTTKQE